MFVKNIKKKKRSKFNFNIDTNNVKEEIEIFYRESSIKRNSQKIIISDYKNYKNSLINVRQLTDMSSKMILEII